MVIRARLAAVYMKNDEYNSKDSAMVVVAALGGDILYYSTEFIKKKIVDKAEVVVVL